MKLRISPILAPRVSGRDSLFKGVNLTDLTFTLKSRIYMSTWYTMFTGVVSPTTPFTFTLKDNRGDLLDCVMTIEAYDSFYNTGVITLNIPLKSPTDSTEIMITLEHSDYHTFSEIIPVYGVDMGNHTKYTHEYDVVPTGDVGLFTALTPEYTTEFMPHSLLKQSRVSKFNNIVVFDNPPFIIELIPITVDLNVGLGFVTNDTNQLGCATPVIAIPSPIDKGILKFMIGISNAPSVPVYFAYRIGMLDNTTGIETMYINNTTKILDTNSFTFYGKVMNAVGVYVNGIDEYTTVYKSYLPVIKNLIDGVEQSSSFTGYGNITFNVNVDETNVNDVVIDRRPIRVYSGIIYAISINKSGIIVYNEQNKILTIDSDTILSSGINTNIVSPDHVFDIDESGNYSIRWSTILLDYMVTNAMITGLFQNANYGLCVSSYHGYQQANFINYGASANQINEIFSYVYPGIAGPYDSAFIRMYTSNNNFSVFAPVTVNIPRRHKTPDYIINDGLISSLPVSFNTVGYIELNHGVRRDTMVTMIGNEDYTVTTKSCSSVEVTLFNNNDHIVTLYRFDEETEVYQPVINYPVTYTNSFIIDSLSDGLYKVVMNQDEFVFISNCSIINCWITAIKGITCGCCEHDDCKSKAYNKFNVLRTLIDTYFNLLAIHCSDIYAVQNIITTYPLNVQIELIKLQRRIHDVCDECPTLSKPCKSC